MKTGPISIYKQYSPRSFSHKGIHTSTYLGRAELRTESTATRRAEPLTEQRSNQKLRADRQGSKVSDRVRSEPLCSVQEDVMEPSASQLQRDCRNERLIMAQWGAGWGHRHRLLIVYQTRPFLSTTNSPIHTHSHTFSTRRIRSRVMVHWFIPALLKKTMSVVQ